MDTFMMIASVLFVFWIVWGFDKTQYDKNTQRAKVKKEFLRKQESTTDDKTTSN